MSLESTIWLEIAKAGANQAGALGEWGEMQPDGVHRSQVSQHIYQHLGKLFGTEPPSEGHVGATTPPH